jgi:mannose-6-phosphate isomerase-like protein (cupin superfamily)
MKHTKLEFSPSFEVVLETAKAQAAVMTLLPGQTTGGEDNIHASSEQWLFVVSGAGEAIVAGQRRRLELHSLIVIEVGEAHEIRNTGDAPLETLNIYTPPEY